MTTAPDAEAPVTLWGAWGGAITCTAHLPASAKLKLDDAPGALVLYMISGPIIRMRDAEHASFRRNVGRDASCDTCGATATAPLTG